MNIFLNYFKEIYLVKIIVAILLFFFSFSSTAQVDKNSELYKIIKSKDSTLFEIVFNKCEMEKIDEIISENIEFYHDLAGIQNREEFINAIKNNICSNPGVNQRSLVLSTLEVYSMENNGKLYGAIQTGKHTFQQKINDKMQTVGIANFTHLWLLENNIWKLKRILSYNHKPFTE